MSRLAIYKMITTERQKKTWMSLYCTACRLVLLSHFNITKLFLTTSSMFADYILDSQVSRSSCMSIKTGLFFLSEFLFYHYSSFWYYKWLLCYEKLKSGENKNKLRHIYHNNHENFKNSKSSVQFYWFECTVFFIAISAWCQSSWIFQCNGFKKWL